MDRDCVQYVRLPAFFCVGGKRRAALCLCLNPGWDHCAGGAEDGAGNNNGRHEHEHDMLCHVCLAR